MTVTNSCELMTEYVVISLYLLQIWQYLAKWWCV